MIKKIIVISCLLNLAACLYPFAGYYGKGSYGTGAKQYKYRCKTANDCCEVGKNCEEDLKKEESKK